MLTQAALARALGVPPADVSILCKAFKLAEDDQCAVIVRKGKRYDVVSYHPRAVTRFRQLVAHPPGHLNAEQKSALNRVLRRLALASH